MASVFSQGDGLVIEKVPLAFVRRGDVVVYRVVASIGELEDRVHRIIGVSPDGLVAKGDDNFRPDGTPVTEENLVGRVTHVEIPGEVSKPRAVASGRRGLALAAWLRLRSRLRARVGILFAPYRWLRRSGLASRAWHPTISKVTFSAGGELVVKYVNEGRTIARWWPSSRRFECRKPFDLVLSPPGKSEPN